MSRWVPDKEAPTCHRCGLLFTFRKRRHHCRRCGNVVCDICSQQKQELQPGLPPERVCDLCVFIIDVPDLFQAPADPRPSQYVPLSHQPSILLAASPRSSPSSQPKTRPAVVFKSDRPQGAPATVTSGTSLPTTYVHSGSSANTPSEGKEPVLRRMRSASAGADQDEDLVAEFFKDISEEVARKYNRHAPVGKPGGKPLRSQGNYQTMQSTHSRPPNLLVHQGPSAARSAPLHRSTHSLPDNYGAILRPFAKPPEVIRQLIAMMASPEGLVYMSEVCENPFRATAHPASIEALEELLGRGQQVDFGAVPPTLKDQLPNLLKSYVFQSDYHFGEDVASDQKMASVCAAIVAGGRFYQSFSGICIAFSALKDLEPTFLQLSLESC